MTGAVGWRRDGLKYKRNEVFLDVTEKVSALVGVGGTVLRADVSFFYLSFWRRRRRSKSSVSLSPSNQKKTHSTSEKNENKKKIEKKN